MGLVGKGEEGRGEEKERNTVIPEGNRSRIKRKL